MVVSEEIEELIIAELAGEASWDEKKRLRSGFPNLPETGKYIRSIVRFGMVVGLGKE